MPEMTRHNTDVFAIWGAVGWEWLYSLWTLRAKFANFANMHAHAGDISQYQSEL